MGILVGFRFRPPDEQSINLLSKKRLDPDFPVQEINEVDLHDFDLYPFAIYWKFHIQGCETFAKYINVVGGEELLVFCNHRDAYENRNAKEVMNEFHLEYSRRLEVETHQLHNLHMIYNFRNHVAENSYSRVRMVKPQQLPSHHLPFDSRNHVAENTVQRDELVSSFDSRNHVAENISCKGRVSTCNCYSIFGNRNHVAENNYFKGRISKHNLSSQFRNHIAEKYLFYRNHVAEKYISNCSGEIIPEQR